MEEKPSFIGTMTDDLINRFIKEIRKKKNKEKIKKYIIDPVLSDINDRYYSLVMTLVILLTTIIILLLILVINAYITRDTIV
jgi:pyridoxal/pyridoxine/pyridoxamine kinase